MSSSEASGWALIASLSVATDLGMGQPLEHALALCLASVELAQRLGCSAGELSDVYYLALVEHVGCTATATEVAHWNGGEAASSRHPPAPPSPRSTGGSRLRTSGFP